MTRHADPTLLAEVRNAKEVAVNKLDMSTASFARRIELELLKLDGLQRELREISEEITSDAASGDFGQGLDDVAERLRNLVESPPVPAPSFSESLELLSMTRQCHRHLDEITRLRNALGGIAMYAEKFDDGDEAAYSALTLTIPRMCFDALNAEVPSAL